MTVFSLILIIIQAIATLCPELSTVLPRELYPPQESDIQGIGSTFSLNCLLGS